MRALLSCSSVASMLMPQHQTAHKTAVMSFDGHKPGSVARSFRGHLSPNQMGDCMSFR